MSESKTSERRFYCKGKRVKESEFIRRQKAQETAKNLRNIYGSKKKHNPCEPVQNSSNASQAFEDLEGRRIIHLKTSNTMLFFFSLVHATKSFLYHFSAARF